MHSQSYEITNNSIIKWTGKAAFNSYNLTGTISVIKGSFKIKNNLVTDFEISIDMKSIEHENTDLKKHLRSEDFFDVKSFKVSKFKLTEPALIENNSVTLIGLLTIKDTSRKEALKLKLDLTKNLITGILTINRTLYGASFRSPSLFEKIKEDAISDDFKLECTLELEKI